MQQWPSPVNRVLDAAVSLGLEIQIHHMQETTRTAVEAAQACGCAVGQIVKSLVFATDAPDHFVLFLVSGDNRVNEKMVEHTIGQSISRADGKRVREVTSFAIGGIPPLGHKIPLETYFDKHLLKFDTVWAAAGTPFHVFPIAPAKLANVVGAKIIDVA